MYFFLEILLFMFNIVFDIGVVNIGEFIFLLNNFMDVFGFEILCMIFIFIFIFFRFFLFLMKDELFFLLFILGIFLV